MESGLFPKKLYLAVQLRLLFLYLVFFPFGQLLHLFSQIISIKLISYPTDIFVIFSAILAILFNFKIFLKKDYIFRNFIIYLIFSFILSIFTFGLVNTLVPGFLYLTRFISYLILFSTVSELVKNKLVSKKFLIKILLFEGVLVAVLGLIQFVFLPDNRFLHVYGWDDHYYRLISTFLDPAFTGIILVLSLILAVKSKNIFVSLLLMLAILLTYSRASYLALAVLTMLWFLKNFRINKILILLVCLTLLLFSFSPRPGGEGVNLLRTASIKFKLANFEQSLDIIKQYPLFGVGYNNVCLVKPNSYFVYENHACGGLDNSFLFLLATTGVLGLISLSDSLIKLYKSLAKNRYFSVIVLSAIAVLIHMQFTNTLVYPFILGWFAILSS